MLLIHGEYATQFISCCVFHSSFFCCLFLLSVYCLRLAVLTRRQVFRFSAITSIVYFILCFFSSYFHTFNTCALFFLSFCERNNSEFRTIDTHLVVIYMKLSSGKEVIFFIFFILLTRHSSLFFCRFLRSLGRSFRR